MIKSEQRAIKLVRQGDVEREGRPLAVVDG
jgi:hypothetical protein